MDFLQNLGRLHPLVVHIPLGILLLVILIELLALKSRYGFLKPATNIILFVGAFTALIACILGYYLSLEGGYDETLLEDHEHAGIALAILSTMAFLLKLWYDKVGSVLLKRLYHLFVFLFVPALMLAGHYGGSLTHGEDYLSNVFPFGGSNKEHIVANHKPLKKLDSAQAFSDVVKPILEEKCEQCHYSGKKKGGLDVSTPQQLTKGGSNGIVLVAGFSDQSALFQRLMLPEGNKQHMPPKGLDQLSDEEKKIIQWWINQGCPYDKRVGDLTTDDDTKSEMKKVVGIEDNNAGLFLEKVSKADPKVLEALNASGLIVAPIAQSTNFLSVDVVNVKDKFNDEQLKLLSPIINQIAWLNLRKSKITDDGLNLISKMNHLQRLHLELTNVTDVGVTKLSRAKDLMYLNLYGTKVTDKGLVPLTKIKNLNKLYLWQTEVTTKAIEKAKEENKELIIN